MQDEPARFDGVVPGVVHCDQACPAHSAASGLPAADTSTTGDGSEADIDDAVPDNLCDGRSTEQSAQFFDALPDAVQVWKSFLITFVVCIATGTLHFVLLPNSNPLKDPQRKGVWHCAVGCAIVWMPMSISYIVSMSSRWVLRGSGVSLVLSDLVLMWSVSAAFYVSSVLFWNSIWVYPFPFGGFPSALGGLIALGVTMWVRLYRRFRRLSGTRDVKFKTLLFKGVMVFVVFVWSLTMLVLIMILLGASQHVPTWTCVFIFPAVRLGAKGISEVLLRFIDDEATIVAENLSMTTFGVGLTLLVGNGGEPWLAVAIAAIDVSVGMVTSLQMHDNRFLRASLRVRGCFRAPTEERVQRAIAVGKATFIASEVGEVIVPITYMVVFLIVYHGPHADGYTGIGTTDFGVRPPKDIPSFLQTMAILIVGDAVGTVLLKVMVNYLTGLDVMQEMFNFYEKYGLILTVQTIWIIHTAFCAVMIQCGLDYSYKLEMAQR